MKRFISILRICALTLAFAAPSWAGGNFKPADSKALELRIISEPRGYDQPMQLPGAAIEAPLGSGYWYISRAGNTCGVSTYGNGVTYPGAVPVPRVTTTCP